MLSSSVAQLEYVAAIQHKRIKAMLVSYKNMALMKSDAQLSSLILNGKPRRLDELKQDIDRILNSTVGSISQVSSAGVFSSDKRVIASTSDIYNTLNIDEVTAAGSQYRVKFVLFDNRSYVVFVEPIEVESNVIGYIALAFSDIQLREIVNDYTGLGNTGEIVLAALNETGDAIFLTPTRHDPSVAFSLTISPNNLEIPITDAMTGVNDVFENYVDYRDIPVLAISHHIPEAGWGMIVKIDKSEVFKQLSELNNQSLNVLLFTFVVVFFVSLLVVNRLARPYDALIKAMSETAKGKKTTLEFKSNVVEVNDVVSAFNFMIEKIKLSERNLRESIKVLTELNIRLDSEAERFKRWKESNFIGIIHSDAKGNILDANTTMLDMIGYTHQELENNEIDWKKLTPKEYLSLDLKAIDEANRQGYWTPFEKVYIHKDGHEVPILIGGSIFKESTQEFIVFVVNLSEKYQQVRELEEYKGIIENSHDMLAFVDKNYRFKTVNQAYLNLHSKERHQVIGRLLPEILGEEFFYHTIKSKIDRALEGEQVSFVETVRVNEGQKVVTLKISYIPYRSNKGEIIGFIFKGEDISELRAKERTIELKEKEQKQIIDSMLEGVFTADCKGKILSFNPEAERIFGYKEEEIVGKSIDRLTEEVAHHEKMMKNYLATGVSHVIDHRVIRTIDARHKEGHLFPIRVAVASMPLNQHGERHFIANFQDMSEYEQQRAQLNRSLKLDSLGNVAGGVAHDFNNILGIIVGYASLLSSSELDRQQFYIEAIEKACNRGQKLTKSLLTFAKKGNQGASKVNLNDLIAKNRQLLETAITSKIILNLELSTCDCFTNVEEDLFENMLLNMSINAMHAMPDGGSITIATECMHLSSVQANRLALKSGKYIKLTISDTGFGIPKENIDKIFDPFFTTKADFGTGLGLSQCYGFIKSCDGVIDVSSTEGEGTVFEIFLPCLESEGNPVIQEEKSIGVPMLSGIKSALVIDDEHDLRVVIRSFLEAEGINVFDTSEPKEAISIVESESLDVVISDIIMPQISGLDLMQHIKQIKPQMPHLFVTGFFSIQSDAEEYSEEEVLSKPFTKKELFEKLNKICGT
ncbi:MAG: PAS domain S-box protein [Thalassotalea sp.]|nr:PAS domain S-box protein [Thalassotalea sp.]